MPSAFTHVFVAAAAGRAAAREPVPARLWIALVALSVLPDADSLGFALGVPYSDPFGHRGFFHSPAFALIASAAVTPLVARRGRLRTWILLFIVAASHGFMDAMTNGGLGIAFLAPFSNERMFLPFRPILVSPISVRAFFSSWGAAVLATEIVYVWIPVAATVVVIRWFRSARARPRAAGERR